LSYTNTRDMEELKANQRIILSVDCSLKKEAEYLALLAKNAGARFIKFGLELSSATSWHFCSQLASANQLEWVADAKLDDIPNTVTAAIKNLKNLKHPPFAITIHTTIGVKAMKAAQQEAGDIKILGVTVLTSLSSGKDGEAERIFHVPVNQKVLELSYDATTAGITGIVASPLEVASIKKDPRTSGLLTMIPGCRSSSVNRGDQARTTTPVEAILAGADLLVIGRQITQAQYPAQAYTKLISEIAEALEASSGA
jgi:orotidine-5'-phosphate decarboxylase